MTDLFNFYLDRETREKVQEKLGTLLPGHKKGLTASLLRIMLIQFLAMKEVPQLLLDAVEADYNYMASKNKRGQSRL